MSWVRAILWLSLVNAIRKILATKIRRINVWAGITQIFLSIQGHLITQVLTLRSNQAHNSWPALQELISQWIPRQVMRSLRQRQLWMMKKINPKISMRIYTHRCIWSNCRNLSRLQCKACIAKSRRLCSWMIRRISSRRKKTSKIIHSCYSSSKWYNLRSWRVATGAKMKLPSWWILWCSSKPFLTFTMSWMTVVWRHQLLAYPREPVSYWLHPWLRITHSNNITGLNSYHHSRKKRSKFCLWSWADWTKKTHQGKRRVGQAKRGRVTSKRTLTNSIRSKQWLWHHR